MEKVKITVGQEEALNNYIKHCKDNEVDTFYRFVTLGKHWVAEWKCLSFFNPTEFSLLLNGWYEVEQPVKFEIGDWVLFKDEDTYHKIISIEKGTRDRYRFSDTSFEYLSYLKSDYEKITEQWKIMLLNLGREKPEFNKNDIIVTESEVYEAEYLTDEEIIVLFEKDLVRAFHAAEHRIEVKGNES